MWTYDNCRIEPDAMNAATEMAMVEASQTQSVVTLKDVLDAEFADIRPRP